MGQTKSKNIPVIIFLYTNRQRGFYILEQTLYTTMQDQSKKLTEIVCAVACTIMKACPIV